MLSAGDQPGTWTQSYVLANLFSTWHQMVSFELPHIFAIWTEQCKREYNYRSFFFKLNTTAHPLDELDWCFCWTEGNIVLLPLDVTGKKCLPVENCLWASQDQRKHPLNSWKKNGQVWQVSGCAAPLIRLVFTFVTCVFLILRKTGSFSWCLST